MKIYVYDFTANGMEVSGSQGNGIGLCCYDDESIDVVKTSRSFDHADMSLFGREMRDGGAPCPIPFFGGVSNGNTARSIGFGDLLIYDDAGMDLYEDLNGV